ncbi:MAG TPA: hypothetical protein VMD92_08975 [Acidobacteriaceae bacterium]|jgi:hypothetical protein|nr:hypothetical protein [Acidobacteriaceae bacterium]
MRKPAGVTAAAVVMSLMALLGILCVSLFLVVFLFMHNPVNLPGFRVIVVLSNLFVLGFFIFCGWTVVGLFRMRRWARGAAIVIGALVCLFSGGAGVGMLVVRNYVPGMPSPAPGEPASILSTLPVIFIGLAAVYFAVALIGLWWVIYFSLPKVRDAFRGAGLMVTNPEIVPHGGSVLVAPAAGGGASAWRVVIIVWACLMLLAILDIPIVFVMHAPLFLFGAVVSGGAETAIMASMAVLWLVMAVGLIRKWKFAWYLGIAWQIYTLAFALSFLIPGMWSRFIAYEENLISRWSLPGTAEMTSAIWHGPFMAICFGLGIVVVIVVTIALFKRKEDYLGA